jgi:hypothetical protein
MHKTIKYLLKILFIVLGFSLVLATLVLWINSYDDFVHFILQKAGKLDKSEKFKTEYLTYDKFLFIRYLVISISLFTGFIIYRFYHFFEEKITALAVFLFSKIKNQIRSISKKDFQFFLIIILITSGIKIYYFFTQPITNDETFTFLNYVKPGFLAAISYYNLTNNHILHSILCNVFDLLPFSPVYTLRIASFLSGLLMLFAAYLFFGRLLNPQAKYIAFSFFAFTLPILQYGVLARGYSLLMFFAIISTSILLALTKSKENRKKQWLIYLISSALGFYTIPVYLYVYLSQAVFYTFYIMEQKKLNYLKEFFYFSLLIALTVFTLYSPVLLLSGINSLTGYDFMQRLTFSKFMNIYPEFIKNYFVWLSGNNPYFSIFVLIAATIGFIYSFKNKKILFLLIISFLLTPLITIAIQQTISFYRLLIFNTLTIALSLGLFTEFLTQRIKFDSRKKNILLISFSVLISIILFLSFANLCKKEKEINLKAYHFATLIENNTTIFSTNEVRYYTFLKFKAMYLDKKKIELFRDNFDKNFPYDYISEDQKTEKQFVSKSTYKYVLIYKDEYIRLYKKQ